MSNDFESPSALAPINLINATGTTTPAPAPMSKWPSDKDLRKMIRRMRDIIADIADNIDEGDGSRSYFGSTNDADELKALARELNDMQMTEVIAAENKRRKK